MFNFTALTSDVATHAAQNMRRQIFYTTPGGSAPLAGLLSLVDPEETDGPEFSWFEQRYAEKVGKSRSHDGIVLPFRNVTTASAVNPLPVTAGQSLRVWVSINENISNWVVGERVIIHQACTGTGSPKTYVDLSGTINALGSGVDAANTYFDITVDTTVSLINSVSTDYVGYTVQSMGKPQSEGSLAGDARRPVWPVNPGNYCQIFRKKFGFTRTQLAQPAFWDRNGFYDRELRDTGNAHLAEIDNALMFGTRNKTSVTGDDGGTPSVKREMGGILWFLQEWEKANGGTFTYRPNMSAATAITDDDKLIIPAPDGAFTAAQWEMIEERAFRMCQTASMEKLVIGGAGAIAAALKGYDGRITIQRSSLKDELKLEYKFTTVETRHGTLHFATHPRFTRLPGLRHSAFILDLANIKLRPLVGADTHLREEIQANDFDGRQDDFLSELSLELRNPESCMYLTNVRSVASS